jgi:phospholipid N-methyltransferase
MQKRADLEIIRGTKSQTPDSKKPAQGGLSVVTWRSAFQVTEYGAADGTRTRDPRRDRPVF